MASPRLPHLFGVASALCSVLFLPHAASAKDQVFATLMAAGDSSATFFVRDDNLYAASMNLESAGPPADGSWDQSFEDLGAGCCTEYKSVEHLFDDQVSDRAECEKKCLGFPDCGFMLYGWPAHWTGMGGKWCTAMRKTTTCSSRKAGTGDCGTHGNTGVHTYKLKTTIKPALWEKGVRKVSCMQGSCLILKSDGDVLGLGTNMGGQFGAQAPYFNYPAAKIELSGITGIVDVAFSMSHALFLKEDGRVLATGDNTVGAIGTGAPDAASTGATGSTAPKEVMRDVVAVSTGLTHTLLLQKNGTLYATGSNDYGQLGLGGTGVEESMKYVPVEVLKGVKAISAGYYISAAVMKDGSLMVTGGQPIPKATMLGLGDAPGVVSWTKVPGISDAKAVSCGVQHTLVLKADGTLLSAGSYGGETAESFPTFTKIAEKVSSAAAGVANSVVLFEDGRFFGIGAGTLGMSPGPITTASPELVPVEFPASPGSPAGQSTRLWSSGTPAVAPMHGPMQGGSSLALLAGLAVLGFSAAVAVKRRAAAGGDAGEPLTNPLASPLE